MTVAGSFGFIINVVVVGGPLGSYHTESCCCFYHTSFLMRTSNFGSEAERSYLFLQCEARNIRKIFPNFHQTVLT